MTKKSKSPPARKAFRRRRSAAPSVGQPVDQRENSFAIETKHAVEPGCERRGEVGVSSPLPGDSAFNITNRHYADEKITHSNRPD